MNKDSLLSVRFPAPDLPACQANSSPSPEKSQDAKSLELRAATALARLCLRQGKRREGYDLLAPIYNWFTEGFDTRDLREAKGLLKELQA